MSTFETLQDFAGKVDWEGGISEAIAYGLTEEDIPDDGSEDSTRLFRAWADARGSVNEIEDILERYRQ